jgi:predicted house-cleaning noncanonical NTP pyrophosphatase (MazG superfamily)
MQEGSIIHYTILDTLEFDKQLRIKLLEEAEEVQAAQTMPELIEELADVQEIIEELIAVHKLDKATIEAARVRKSATKGSYSERIYVTEVEHPVGSYSERYCSAHPDKFPEIK